MDERKQFTFYASFANAVKRIRKKADRCDAYDAIVNYALMGELPDLDALPDAAAIAFELAKPNIDASRRKSAGGKNKATSDEDTAKIPSRYSEDTAKISSRYAEDSVNKKKNKKEKEKENKCLLQVEDAELARVFNFFLDRVDPMPSSSCTEDLKAYTENMGADVVIHACEVARDAKGVQAGWSYIRGILRRYAENKVTSMEDVLRLEQQHQNKTKMPTVAPTSAYATPDDVAKALELFEGVS